MVTLFATLHSYSLKSSSIDVYSLQPTLNAPFSKEVNMKICRLFPFIAIGLSLSSYAEEAQSVRGWRNDGTGRFPQANPPLTWSLEDNILWKTTLPGKSHSSTVLWGDHLFVTAEPTELLCLSKAKGEILWSRSHTWEDVFGSEKAKLIAAEHQKAEELKDQLKSLRKEMNELRKADRLTDEKRQSYQEQQRLIEGEIEKQLEYPPPKKGGSDNACPTPVTDGNRVFVTFANGIVASYSFEGKRNWIQHVPASTSGFGYSASPVLAGDKLLIHYKNLTALDANTGEVVWSKPIPHGWGSSLITSTKGVSLLITPSGCLVNIQDGHLLSEKLFRLSHNSPIFQNGVIYAFQGGRNKAIKIPLNGNLDSKSEWESETLWEEQGFNQRTFSSALFHEDLLYTITEKGILDVIDAASGDLVYRKRLEFGRGRVYASLALAGNRIFSSSDNGTTIVFKPGKKFEQVSRNELESGMSSCPVFEETRMYVRTKGHMFCIQHSPANR